MRVLDASSIIYGWDNYPFSQFPPLWKWIGKEIKSGDLCIPEVAFEEVDDKYPECADWLNAQGIKKLKTTAAVLELSVKIKSYVGIVGDNYHPKGVGENDILIIATAKLSRAELISDEEKQITMPTEQRKRKIPAVCAMQEVGVSCISFLDYFKDSKQVFGS